MKLTEKRFKYTFFTSIFVGLAAHLFALTNVLQNYDNISQTPVGVGTGVTSASSTHKQLGPGSSTESNFISKYLAASFNTENIFP